MQEYRIAQAERTVRQEAHDRWHRELEDGMKEINAMNAFMEANPNTAYTTHDAVTVLAAGGEGGAKHLQTKKKEA